MDDGVRYAEVEGARVAYQVHGAGDLDIVYSPGLASHLDMTWEQSRYRRYVEELQRFGRVIRFDRRGTGISDPAPSGNPDSWETWADDLRAVLDAVGSRRTAVLATNDAGAAAMLFAATDPDRVSALVLFNTTSRFTDAPGYATGHPPEVATFVADVVRDTWGTEGSLPILAPSLASDESFSRWYPRFQRAACSPASMAETLGRVLRMDARPALPEIACPTLVIHRTDYGTIPVAQAEHVAATIPQARLVVVPGADAPIYTEGTAEILHEIGAFLGAAPRAVVDDRVFSAVLFSDIVGSTTQAAAVGDPAWKRVLVDHDEVARGCVAAHGGRFIKSTGDGILARFDAPGRALRAAMALRAAVDPIGITLRIGVHAGPVILLEDGDIGGLAVHAAARVMGAAADGDVWASGDLVGLVTDPGLAFADQGVHELKGVPEPQRLFSVVPVG